jgi:hypothetical protein
MYIPVMTEDKRYQLRIDEALRKEMLRRRHINFSEVCRLAIREAIAIDDKMKKKVKLTRRM